MNRRQKPAETFENDPKLPKTKRSASGNQPEADPSMVILASPVQMPSALW
jgi:hypothetical protein